MSTTYRLKTSDLNEKFLQSVKALYGESEVEIAIASYDDASEDETAYLLKSEANKQHLLQALQNVEQGRNLVTVHLEDLQ